MQMSIETIFDSAEEHGWLDDFGRWNFTDDGLIDFVIAVAKAEREACAKVADAFDPEQKMSNYGQVIADRIRARGET
jgi:hypothetical protein